MNNLEIIRKAIKADSEYAELVSSLARVNNDIFSNENKLDALAMLAKRSIGETQEA